MPLYDDDLYEAKQWMLSENFKIYGKLKNLNKNLVSLRILAKFPIFN